MIMDSRASLASQESETQIRMINPRKRPLHTCAVTILVIAHRAFTIVQGLNGPLGLIVNIAARLATLAGPFAYAIQHQWLTMAVLSFIDGRILAAEDMIERFYPPSQILFNKMDDLVHVTESLPGKFDNAVSKLPSYVNRISVLDWALVRVISLLNFVVTTLTYWRMSKSTREKEIKVDTHTTSKADRNIEPDRPKELSTNINAARGDPIYKGAPIKGATYKEVLLQKRKNNNKGGIEEKAAKIHKTKEEVESNVAAAAGDDDSDSSCKDDPLLELFDSAWLMTPARKANYAPRSVSFTY